MIAGKQEEYMEEEEWMLKAFRRRGEEEDADRDKWEAVEWLGKWMRERKR